MAPRRAELTLPILVGLLVAGMVMAAGAAVADRQAEGWTAEGALLVVPRTNVTERALAGYYESLSRGLIPATYAEILDSSAFRAELPAAARSPLRYVGAEVVPDTTVIALETHGATPARAEDIAGEVVDAAATYVEGLGEPYTVTAVASGRRTAERRGTDPDLVLAAAVVAALLLGVASAVAVARWRRGSDRVPVLA